MRQSLLLVAGVSLWYFAGLHPWLMNWGATADERAMALPGDELLPAGAPRFTRAITIEAPAARVWQWIVQMGQERAGFYSYTWLENLTGADIHNAWEIRAEWQGRALGDRVRLARADLLGGRVRGFAETRIEAIEPERMIANIPGRFVLLPMNPEATRLLLREERPAGGARRVMNALWWDPTHFAMQQRMLRGIKERAEGRRLVPAGVMTAARAGWAAAGLALAAFFARRRRRAAWLALPVAAAAPAMVWTHDAEAALAGALAVGITAAGALAMGRRWWPGFLTLATAAALVLLMAPDAYATLGLTFDGAAIGAAAWWIGHNRSAAGGETA